MSPLQKGLGSSNVTKDEAGNDPFKEWRSGLRDGKARATINTRLRLTVMPKRINGFRVSLLEGLRDPEEAKLYVNAALEVSQEMFLVALRDVAEANQMAKVAESACVARESLYRMLSPTGNPTYGTLSSILAANGLRFRVDVVSPVKTDVPLVVMHEAVNGKS